MEPLKSAAASSSPRAALGFDTAFERETQNLSNPNNAEDGPESFCILYGKIVGSTRFSLFLFASSFSSVAMFRCPGKGTGFCDPDLFGKHDLLEALHSIGALVHAARSSGTVPGVGGNIVERYPFPYSSR